MSLTKHVTAATEQTLTTRHPRSVAVQSFPTMQSSNIAQIDRMSTPVPGDILDRTQERPQVEKPQLQLIQRVVPRGRANSIHRDLLFRASPPAGPRPSGEAPKTTLPPRRSSHFHTISKTLSTSPHPSPLPRIPPISSAMKEPRRNDGTADPILPRAHRARTRSSVSRKERADPVLPKVDRTEMARDIRRR